MTNLPLVLQLLVAAVAIIAAITDIRWRRIPNWLVLPAIPVGLLLNWYLNGTAGLARAAIGFGVGFGFYFILYLLHGMGAGDVKLMGALGALAGWPNWLIIFIITGLLGLVIALYLMLTRKRFRRTLWNSLYVLWELAHMRPPHMAKEELDIHSPKAFTLPHGAVIALGCLTYLGASSALLP